MGGSHKNQANCESGGKKWGEQGVGWSRGQEMGEIWGREEARG